MNTSQAVEMPMVARYSAGMQTPRKWKENVRASLSKAQDRGMKLSAIAEATGMRRQSLSQFITTGRLGDDKVEAVAEWLQKAGYMDAEPDSPPTAAREALAPYGGRGGTAEPEPASHVLATYLQALAGVLLNDDFSADHKTREFVSFIERCHRNIDSYRAALQKGQKD